MTTRSMVSGFILGALLCVSFASPTKAALVFCAAPTYPPTIAEQQAYVNCQKQWLDEPKEEQEKRAEENRIYQERASALAPYSQFFDEVGVALSTTTSESKYKKWLKDLAEAQDEYSKEQKAKQQQQQELAEQEAVEKKRQEDEAQAKIKELEDRVKVLESRPATPVLLPPKAVEPSPIVASPTEQRVETDTDNATSTPPPQTPLKKDNWFTRIINWFLGK